MNKLWHDEAWEDYVYWQTQDKKYLKKINRLLKDIDRNGYNCINGDSAKNKEPYCRFSHRRCFQGVWQMVECEES